MPLSTKQKAYLRSLGQTLRPQLQIGHGGYSEGVRTALEDLLRTRELIKGRILNTSEEEPKELAARLAGEVGAEVAGVVGKTFLLYRPNPQLKERIELPPARAQE
ncbi:MAG: YhbY family RNA-binding protein [Armatimonadota bacterium]